MRLGVLNKIWAGCGCGFACVFGCWLSMMWPFWGCACAFHVWKKVLVNSSFNLHQLHNIEANRTYNFKNATFFILGKLQILWRYLKFLRSLLYIFLRCLPKISSLFPSNYGGNVLNEVQPCNRREDKNLEKHSQKTKKRKLVVLLVFNLLLYFFSLDFLFDGGCLVDYPECQNQSCKGSVNNNDC